MRIVEPHEIVPRSVVLTERYFGVALVNDQDEVLATGTVFAVLEEHTYFVRQDTVDLEGIMQGIAARCLIDYGDGLCVPSPTPARTGGDPRARRNPSNLAIAKAPDTPMA